MPSDFKQILEYARELETANHGRNEIYDAMQNLYFMKWTEEAAVRDQIENVKVTRSPRARNAVRGAARLLIASDPVISVPFDTNTAKGKDQADKVEKFCKAMWGAAGRFAGKPIHYDAVLSGILFDRIIIGIDSIADMLKSSNGSSEAVTRRLEEVQKRTPYLFEVYNPKSCYEIRGRTGVEAFYRKVDTTAGKVMDTFGGDGKRALMASLKRDISRYDAVTLCDFYDLEERAVWVEGGEDFIFKEAHGLPFIPVVCHTVEGTELFDKPQDRIEPFLYTVWKSGLMDRENLILTVAYTMMFAIGAMPMFVEYLMNPEEAPIVDFDQPGGVRQMRVGERREPMAKQVIDPSLLTGWEIANALEQESTIYRQTLGEPLGANAPYSMVALLSQSGRLPLVVTQRMAGWGIGEALEKACRWTHFAGQASKAKYYEYAAELNPDDIPDVLDIKVHLEIELPQDRLQSANSANILSQGDRPLVSQRWVRENILNIGQSADMDQEIFNEMATRLEVERYQLQQMAALQMLRQQALQPGAGSGMPGAPPTAGAGPPPLQPFAPPPTGQTGPPVYGTPMVPQPPEQRRMTPLPPIPPMGPPIQPQE